MRACRSTPTRPLAVSMRAHSAVAPSPRVPKAASVSMALRIKGSAGPR